MKFKIGDRLQYDRKYYTVKQILDSVCEKYQIIREVDNNSFFFK